jgi:hypothetical protein
MLMSPSLQDWLPPNHLARLIVETVERLDLHGIEDSYAGLGKRAYRPKMLVALLLYGYATCSVLESWSACALTRWPFDLSPRTPAPITTRLAIFANVFCRICLRSLLQVPLVAKELGVLTAGEISLDGTKIRANASKHHALSYAHAGKIKAKLGREIARLNEVGGGDGKRVRSCTRHP